MTGDAEPLLVHPRYAPGTVLGSGGQGVVFRVADREAETRALVAKLWRSEAFDEQALSGEFALLARLHVPGLVRAHDLGHDARTGAPFFVEDFVPGADAAEFVCAASAVERPGRWLGVVADVAGTLAQLHDAGFTHGDLKPAHVRITPRAEVVLIDLGVAVSRARIERGRVRAAYSPGFAAPEVLAGGAVSVQSELYGLGALAFALAAGKAPGSKRPRLRSLAPWVPPSAAELVEELLLLHPEDRPATALDVVRRLAAHGALPASALPAPPPIGRERELRALLEREQPGLRYLTGPSGIGKSHLARELVIRALLSGRDARRVAFPCDDPALAARLVQFFRGLDEVWPFTAPSAKERAPLLVLDDLEHAPAELRSALDGWRCATKAKRFEVLATVRDAPPGAERIELGALEQSAFTALAEALGVREASEVEARARASKLNPGWLVALSGRVPATLDMVKKRVSTLSAAARELFSALALCGGEARETTLFALLGTDGARTPAPLAELLSASLVTRRAAAGRAQYALVSSAVAPEIVSALASFELADRVAELLLADAGTSARALLSVAGAPFSPSRREELLERAARTARAHAIRSEEIEALFALAADPKRRDVRLLRRLERLTRDAGMSSGHPQVFAWLEEAAAEDPAIAPLFLRRAAERAARAGNPAQAHELAARAAAEARAQGDRAGEALALATAGSVALYSADWAQAERTFAAARELLEGLDVEDPEELARLDHNAGIVALYANQLEPAIAAFERALGAKRALGDRAGVRSCLLNLGLALGRAERFAAAETTLDEAVALARSLGQSAGLAWCYAARADLAVRQKRASEAEHWASEAAAQGEAVPVVVRADLAILRAQIALLEGDADRALGALSELGEEQRRADKWHDGRAAVLEAEAQLLLLPADRKRAARLALRALRVAREGRLPELEQQATRVLRAARRTTPSEPRRADGRASEHRHADGRHEPDEASRYAPSMPEHASALSAEWAWLRRVASGTPRDEALLELGRLVAEAASAERVLIGLVAEPAVLHAGWGVDLERFALADVVQRFDAALVASALGASGPVYQREVVRDAGTGSRVALASESGLHGERIVLVIEHRFRAGYFDALSHAALARWATLAQVALRLEPEAAAPSRPEMASRAPPLGAPSSAVHMPSGSDREPSTAITTTALPHPEPRRNFPALLGTSAVMRRALAKLDAAVDSELPLLILGETGTGKELFAQALHAAGPRAKAPFITLNCGAVPDTLFEAELFGHARGAFTGADRARGGLIARAAGGTLLLDEIGELDVGRQAALLRVLETRRFRPVGSDEERPFDVRIIAATNRELDREVQRGAFRQDLFFRLNVIEIRVPALRERSDDIPLLARMFLERAGSHAALSEAALDALSAYTWPGNVRELEHQMQRLAALRVSRVELAHLPRPVRSARRRGASVPVLEPRVEVERALELAGGNITHAARALGLTRHGLKKRMTRLGLRSSGGQRGA